MQVPVVSIIGIGELGVYMYCDFFEGNYYDDGYLLKEVTVGIVSLVVVGMMSLLRWMNCRVFLQGIFINDGYRLKEEVKVGAMVKPCGEGMSLLRWMNGRDSGIGIKMMEQVQVVGLVVV